MKKTHTLLNRHQLLDPVALRNWLAHNLDPVARADQLLTLRPEELNCIFDTLSMPEGASLLVSLPAECAGQQGLEGFAGGLRQPREQGLAIVLVEPAQDGQQVTTGQGTLQYSHDAAMQPEQ